MYKHKVTVYQHGKCYVFEFIPYHATDPDPAELEVLSTIMLRAEEVDPLGIWVESDLLPADHERLIWENQRDWVEVPTAAKVEINWAVKPKDTAKEKAIY